MACGMVGAMSPQTWGIHRFKMLIFWTGYGPSVARFFREILLDIDLTCISSVSFEHP